MANAKSYYLERKIIDHALGTTTYTKPSAVYISLHEDNPTDNGVDTDEVSGGSYSRKVMTFTAAATVGDLTSSTNTADVVWTNLPTCEITHVAIWDASTSGNMLYSAELSAPRTVSGGDGYTIPAGQLLVSEK